MANLGPSLLSQTRSARVRVIQLVTGLWRADDTPHHGNPAPPSSGSRHRRRTLSANQSLRADGARSPLVGFAAPERRSVPAGAGDLRRAAGDRPISERRGRPRSRLLHRPAAINQRNSRLSIIVDLLPLVEITYFELSPRRGRTNRRTNCRLITLLPFVFILRAAVRVGLPREVWRWLFWRGSVCFGSLGLQLVLRLAVRAWLATGGARAAVWVGTAGCGRPEILPVTGTGESLSGRGEPGWPAAWVARQIKSRAYRSRRKNTCQSAARTKTAARPSAYRQSH